MGVIRWLGLLCSVSFVLACSHEIESPTPTLSSVAPDLVCNAATVSAPGGVSTVALSGSNFTPMPSRTLDSPRRLLLPKVTLSPVAAIPGGILPTTSLAIADDPENPSASRVRWTSETAMSFDIAEADALPTGVFDVTVTNPDGSHATTLAQVLAVIPPPIVTAATPPAVCDDQSDQTIVVTGSSFLVYEGATPTVTITTPTGDKTYPSTFAAADCAAIPGTFTERDVQLCTAISFTIPQGDIVVTTVAMLQLVVTNPAPADCASSTAFQITLQGPPRVDAVVPATACTNGQQLTIEGSNFLTGATVTMRCPTIDLTATQATVSADGLQIVATFDGGAPADTDCEIIVTNPDGCEDRPLPHKIVRITTGPIAFFVDPGVVFNGINTRITIYSTTITAPLPSNAVTITLAGVTTQLQFNTVTGFPNRLQAIVPVNQPPGIYDLTLEDGAACPSSLAAAFTVTDTTTVTIANVSPPFGGTSEDTAVTIFRDVTAVAPNDHPFIQTPRVFLNPNNPAASDIAVPLQSVAFLDGNRVTGIVPAGTPVNLYDVVLVNPDGTVGVLVSGYRETADDPPEIATVVPASIVASTGQQVQVAGSGFVAGNTVSLTCVDGNGTLQPAPAVVTGAPTCNGTDCTETITIDGSTLAVGSVCVVRLTNADGTFADFSAIGVTNSSLNLSAPRAGPDMVVGRRALSVAAGNATSANRFVYALGGDSGTAAGALDSVEFAQVDLFGTIGAFVVQPPALRANRTLGGAVTAGRYIYFAGGNDGTGPTTTAERALILSPREAPEVTDVDLQLAAVGLEPGEYHYRVSAVFAANDPDNPGGESLAGDAFAIRVPSFPERKVVLTLIWREAVDSLGVPLPNVIGYRIYRSAANGAPSSEVLIATTPSATPRTFVDDGTAIPGTAVPLPLGSTGTWGALPNLGTPREGLALALGRDPVTPNTLYVYALLGRSSATIANTSYELLPITVGSNGRQTVAAGWTAGTAVSAQGRWQLGAWTVDATVSGLYSAPTTFVFLGGGLTAASTSANKVEAGRVTAGGQLASLDDTPKDFPSTQAGYGVLAANNQLFTFGGAGAAPSTSARSATLVAPPPALANNSWNNQGLSLTHGRYLLGSAVQSSFVFLLGGQTDEPSAASKTTELVVW